MDQDANPYRSATSAAESPARSRLPTWAALTLALAFLAGGLICLCAAVFYGWIATTVGTDETHYWARLYSNLWSAGFFASLAIAGGLVVYIVRHAQRDKRPQA